MRAIESGKKETGKSVNKIVSLKTPQKRTHRIMKLIENSEAGELVVVEKIPYQRVS